jgi:hypothetical protein
MESQIPKPAALWKKLCWDGNKLVIPVINIIVVIILMYSYLLAVSLHKPICLECIL